MKKRKYSVLADLSFQAMLLLMSAAIIFFSFNHVRLAENGILLCITVLIFTVTYFTSVMVGLMIDFGFIFLIGAYTVIGAVSRGISVNTDVYFWIFWPMAMIIAISGYVKQYQLLDRKNKELVRQIERYTTIDELTQMNNLLGFERDSAVYMNISRRYQMELELVLWRLTYQEELEKLLDEEEMKNAINLISDSIKNSLRKEDLIYLIDDKPYIWGTLMFSRPDAAQVVISHVKKSVGRVELKALSSHNTYLLEITGTVVQYDMNIISPLAYLNQAKRKLWTGKAEGEAMLEIAEELTFESEESGKEKTKNTEQQDAKVKAKEPERKIPGNGEKNVSETIASERPGKEGNGLFETFPGGKSSNGKGKGDKNENNFGSRYDKRTFFDRMRRKRKDSAGTANGRRTKYRTGADKSNRR